MFFKKDPKKEKAKKFKEASAALPGIKARAVAREEQKKAHEGEGRSSFGDRLSGAFSELRDKVSGKADELRGVVKDAVLDKVDDTKDTLDALSADQSQWEKQLTASQEEFKKLHAEIEEKLIPKTNDNAKDEKVLAFNKALTKILDDIVENIHKDIGGMRTELTQVTVGNKIAFSKKLDGFQKNKVAFIKAAKNTVIESEQKLKEDTIKELYETLKETIQDPLWKKYAVIGVPTGVRGMGHVLTGTENQKWYYRRKRSHQETAPDYDTMLHRINMMCVIAEERSKANSKRAEPTKQLYEALEAVQIANKLAKDVTPSDLKKLNTCLVEVKKIKKGFEGMRGEAVLVHDGFAKAKKR